MAHIIDPQLDMELGGLLDGIEGGGLDEDDDVAGLAATVFDEPELGARVSPTNRARIHAARAAVNNVMLAQQSRARQFTLYPNYVVTLTTTHVGAGELTSAPVLIRPVGAGLGDAKRRVTLVQMQATLGSAATVKEGAFVKDIQVNEEPTFPTVGASNPIPFELFMPSSYQSPFIYPINLSAVAFRSGDSVTATHIAPAAGIYQSSLYFVTDYTMKCGRGRVPGAASGPTRTAASRVIGLLANRPSLSIPR